MIESRRKNQAAVREAIDDYQTEFPDVLARPLELTRFAKYLAMKLVTRVQEDDCYFIDLLDDVERMEP